jgi:hypothetical protein
VSSFATVNGHILQTHVSLVYSSISSLFSWNMTLRPWFSVFCRFGASYWLYFVGACDKPGAEYPLTKRHIIQQKDASAIQLLNICGPTLGRRVVWECAWEQELGHQGKYGPWSPWARALVFLYFYFISYIHSFLLITNLTHFFQCIYFTPLHVSCNKCPSSGGSNCVNTSSGIIHSSGWLSCVPVDTQDTHPLECIIPDDVLTKFDPPDDGHLFETCRSVK